MKRSYSLIFILSVLFLAPPAVLGNEPEYGFAATVTLGEILNPDKWFEAFKKNITLPLSTSTEIKIPTTEDVLDRASTTLRGINEDIREEVGIDFGKFVGWSARVLKLFFQVITNILEQVAKYLET